MPNHCPLSSNVGREGGRSDPKMPNPKHSWRRAIRQTVSPVTKHLNGSSGGEDEESGKGEMPVLKTYTWMGLCLQYVCKCI